MAFKSEAQITSISSVGGLVTIDFLDGANQWIYRTLSIDMTEDIDFWMFNDAFDGATVNLKLINNSGSALSVDWFGFLGYGSFADFNTIIGDTEIYQANFSFLSSTPSVSVARWNNPLT